MSPQIPTILTKADWDKEKGIIAKVGVGETGVGAAMEKVKAAYNAVNWKKLDARLALNPTPKETAPVDEAFKAAKAEYPKVEKLRQELRALEGLAQKAAAVFKSKALVPKSSTEHALKIATAADHFAVQLKSLDAQFNSFAEMKKQIEFNIASARKALIAYMQKVPGAIAKMESTPTVEAYRLFHKEAVRGLAAALFLQKDLAAEYGPWKVFSQDTFIPKAENEVKPKVAQIKQQFAKLKSVVG